METFTLRSSITATASMKYAILREKGDLTQGGCEMELLGLRPKPRQGGTPPWTREVGNENAQHIDIVWGGGMGEHVRRKMMRDALKRGAKAGKSPGISPRRQEMAGAIPSLIRSIPTMARSGQESAS